MSLEDAVIHGLAQYAIGTMLGSTLDTLFPVPKQDSDPTTLVMEVLGQVAASAALVKLAMDRLVPVGRVDPTGGLFFAHSFLSSQRGLQTRLLEVAGETRELVLELLGADAPKA